MLITRAEAIAQGLTRYYTGKPCKHGHVAARLVSNSGCVTCSIARIERWKLANPERVRTADRTRYNADPAKHTAKGRAWRESNAQYHKEYRALNRSVYAAHCRARQATQLGATPAWADQEAIRDAYAEAAYHGLEVDHIVPLQSPLVSGLHVWDNLQLLTPLENKIKGNRVWPDMPGSA